MSIRVSIAALTIVAGTFGARAAEPARAPASPAVGSGRPAAPAPSANSARPSEPSNAGQSTNAGADPRGSDKNARGENAGDRRGDRHRARIVYVPGYGYTNWSGDYSNPYWSTPGTWYANDGSQSAQQSSTDVNAAPAPIPSTRLQEEAAQAEMISARTRLSREFESSDEVRAALHDVQETQRAYDAAVAEANRRLKQDPDYKQAEAKKQQAARKVEAARAAEPQAVSSGATATRPAPISPEVVGAAQQKLKDASEMTAIATHDAQLDPAVNAAREKLEAAADRLDGMKAKFDVALQSDPQWQAAKQKLDAARVAAPR